MGVNLFKLQNTDKSKEISTVYTIVFSIFGAVLLVSILSIVTSLFLYHQNETFIAALSRERNTFIVAVLFMLPICFTSLFLFQRLNYTRTNIPIIGTWLIIAMWFLFWVASIPVLKDYGQMGISATPTSPWTFVSAAVSSWLIACITVSFIVLLIPVLRFILVAERGSSSAGFITCIIIIVISTLLIYSHCISDLSSVNDQDKWVINFEPVLYSISQVAAGRTLLVDLPSQYGLYAELIAPFIKIFGFSVFGITMLFAIMSAMCYLAIVYVFYSLTEMFLPRIFFLLVQHYL